MTHLLAVSWEMPPMYGPRATQVSRTLAALAHHNWRSTVVCLDPRRGGPHWPDGTAADIAPGVDLLRVPSPEEWTALRVAWWLVPGLRHIPDAKRVWVARAARAAVRASQTTAFAGLITFAQPWSDHLVGLRVRHATGLPWVAHFSDPWVDSPYAAAAPWQLAMSRRMEAEVVREADAVVFVTRETADLVMRKYPPSWRQKVSVVPHGFVSRPAGPETRAGGAVGPMRMVYTGRFYAGVRTPRPLFQALALLSARGDLAEALEVTLVGPGVEAFRSDARELGVDAIVRFQDCLPFAEAQAIAAAADVLLVIDAPSETPSVFLPSKLVDYLPLRKPILGVTPPAGASARLLDRLECPVAPPGDPRAIASAIDTLLRARRGGALAVAPAFDRVAAEFDITRTTAQLHDILERTYRPRPH